MFINESAFKRAVKKAYKAGNLIVGQINEMLYISGHSWIISVDHKAVPNKIKASLIELIGELPGEGEAYEFSGYGGQAMLIDTIRQLDLETYSQAAGQGYQATRVMVQTNNGIGVYMQGLASPKHIIVSKDAYEMFDNDKIDADSGEMSPPSPKLKGHWLVWGNNVMAFAIVSAEESIWEGENEFLNAIKGIDLAWMFTE